MDISKLTEWIKLSPKYLFAISLVTGFLVFASDSTLNLFGLASFVSQYRPYIGTVFLLSTALLLTHWLIKLYEWVRTRHQQTLNLKNIQKRLHALTDDEKRVLRRYIKNNTRTQYFGVNDGTVSGLEMERILFRASIVGRLYEWAYNIQPWAWEYLNAHPELLQLNDEQDKSGHRSQHR